MSELVSKVRTIVLVKLGGSLITEKSQPETARLDVLAQLARQIGQVFSDQEAPAILIGHGSGSFGHVEASRHGLQSGLGANHDLVGVSRTQAQANRLHQLVMTALRDEGVPAYSLSPSSFLMARRGRPEAVWPDPVIHALRLGLLPVVYGDVVMDLEWGASISSTESVFLALIPALASRGVFVERVVWLGQTDGVYDGRGKTHEVLEGAELEDLIEQTVGAAGTDVTGGMRHRLEVASALADQGIDSWIGDGSFPEALRDAVVGRFPGGTRIPGYRRVSET